MRRLLVLFTLLPLACDDASGGGAEGSVSVDFFDPTARQLLSCDDDEDETTPAVEYDVAVLVDGATDGLSVRLSAIPAAGAPAVRSVPERGLVKFDRFPIPTGAAQLVAEVFRGAPPDAPPVRGGAADAGACVPSAGQCPNVCSAGAGVEGEVCAATADCGCGLFCKGETRSCAPYEGDNAGCSCGPAAAGGGAGGGAIAEMTIGLSVEGCGGGLPVDAGPDGAAPGDGGAGDARASDDARPQVDGAETDAARPPDSGPDPDQAVPPDAAPDARAPGMGQYGDRCRCGSDCESGFCIDNKLRAYRTCTDRCDDDNGCPGLDTCVQVAAAGPSAECPDPPGGPAPGELVGVCVPNETGLPCELAQDCSLGICLTPPRPANWINAQNVCTVPCVNDRKCPAGYTCEQPPGANQRVCVFDVEVFSCTSFEQCGGVCNPSIEETTVCIQLEEGGQGYCSCTCSSAADCPRGFACDQDTLPSQDPQRPGHCVLMAGYRCPREVADPNALQCPSYSCATDDEHPERSACTSLCRADGDCPRNYACQDVGGARACLAAE